MTNKEINSNRSGTPAEYELYIMRHGLAAVRSVTTVMEDAKRPLTPEGKQKMREIASAWCVQDWTRIGLSPARWCAPWKLRRLWRTRKS